MKWRWTDDYLQTKSPLIAEFARVRLDGCTVILEVEAQDARLVYEDEPSLPHLADTVCNVILGTKKRLLNIC